MPKWLDELDEIIKGMSKPSKPKEKDQDDDMDGDQDDDGEEEGNPFGKSASVKVDKYAPADNGDDDDEESGAAVRDPDKIDKLTRGGKIKKPACANAGNGVVKSVRDLVDEDTQDAINAADALASIVDAIDGVFGAFGKSFRQITRRLDAFEAGQAAIGAGISKSLQGTNALYQSLQGEVAEIAQQPRGRKGVVKGVERQFAGNKGGEEPVPNRQEICEKSMKALKKGLITAHESAAIESFLNGNRDFGRPPMLPPPALMAKINAAD